MVVGTHHLQLHKHEVSTKESVRVLEYFHLLGTTEGFKEIT